MPRRSLLYPYCVPHWSAGLCPSCPATRIARRSVCGLRGRGTEGSRRLGGGRAIRGCGRGACSRRARLSPTRTHAAGCCRCPSPLTRPGRGTTHQGRHGRRCGRRRDKGRPIGTGCRTAAPRDRACVAGHARERTASSVAWSATQEARKRRSGQGSSRIIPRCAGCISSRARASPRAGTFPALVKKRDAEGVGAGRWCSK